MADKRVVEGPDGPTALTSTEDSAARTDAQLVEEFVAGRSESAFATLLARHGPMVLSVCRRFLQNPHDAQDAFQATFLVLVRKAASIRRRELLANWLYGVAQKVAARARFQAARQPVHHEARMEMAAAERSTETLDSDQQRILHEEINRLPAKYRGAVVLCYLEGLSNRQAALESGCPVGTIKGRLVRARDLLRVRLTHRGVAVSSALLAAALSESFAGVSLPASLVEATGIIAKGFVKGGPVPLPVQKLAQGVLRGMLWPQVKVVVAVITAGSLLAVGSCAILHRSRTDQKAVDGGNVDSKAPNHEDHQKIQGIWRAVSVRIDGQDFPNVGLFMPAPWDIREGKIRVRWPNQTEEMAYTIDPSQKCKTIDLMAVDPAGKLIDGETVQGVYELNGDTLTLCRPLQQNSRRPTEVVSRPGSETMVMVFKR